MKSPIIFLVALLSFSLSCSSSQRFAENAVAQKKDAPATAPETGISATYAVEAQKAQLTQLDKASEPAEAPDRKIIPMPRSRSRFLQLLRPNTR